MVGDADECAASTAADQLDLRKQFDAEVVSAISEIFNNIVIHGYADDGGDVVLELTPSRDRLSVTISDSGLAFDIETVPPPQLESLPEGGMGIHIARACVDQLDYTPGPPNVWRLTKYCKQTSPFSNQA